MTARVLMIDHEDSFVFLLGEQFRRIGATVRTFRAPREAAVLQDLVAEETPDLVVLSPGPGRPEDATAAVSWLRTEPSVPVLGICLGHQAMAVAFGGVVGRAPRPIHGKASTLRCEGPPQAGFEDGMRVGRYHSLTVDRVPTEFEVLVRTEDPELLVMAMRHRRLPYLGMQFHPESVLTPHGGSLLRRVLADLSTTTIS